MGRRSRYGSARFRFHITMELHIAGQQLVDPGGPQFDELTAARIVGDLQEAAVRQLISTYRRPAVATGKLAEAIRSPGMWRLGAGRTEIFMFQRDYMDRTVPYWDAIDRGSTWFSSKRWKLYGYWLDSDGRQGFRTGASEGRLIKLRIGGRGRYSQKALESGRTRHGRMNPRHSAAGDVVLSGELAAGKNVQSKATRGRVTRPIPEHNYVEAARKRFREVDVDTAAREILRVLAAGRGMKP